MKRLQKIKITTLFLGLSILLPVNHIFADVKGTSVDDIGKNTQVHNSLSTLYDAETKMKKSVRVSFIDDPNSDKQLAIISTEGSHIDADKRIFADPGYYHSILRWASSYHITMELVNGNATFYQVAPVNTIDTKNVNSTVGYTIGGNIKVSNNPEMGASGGSSWSTTVSYSQADYKTILETDTDKKVKWNIQFVSTLNQGYGPYTRESNDSIYENQLFMKDRNAATSAKDNFISSEQMPSLAAYGFSPGVLAVILSDKKTDSSDFKLSYERSSDLYGMTWKSFFNGERGDGPGWWIGSNDLNRILVQHTQLYTIDWKNKRLMEGKTSTYRNDEHFYIVTP